MNLLSPVKEIMTTNLITVSENDPLIKVKQIFDEYDFHHIPVLDKGKLCGIISKSDLLFFVRGFTSEPHENYDKLRLKTFAARDIMTKALGKMESSDRINVALEVFKKNLFHAIPIEDNGDLVGIVTTHDIIKHLSMNGENNSKV